MGFVGLRLLTKQSLSRPARLSPLPRRHWYAIKNYAKKKRALSLLLHPLIAAPPYGLFPSSIARQPREGANGANTERCVRVRKALGDMFSTPTLSGTIGTRLFHLLSRCRTWKMKIGPGECDIHRRIIEE